MRKIIRKLVRNSGVGVSFVLGLTLLGGVRRVDAQVDPCALLTLAEVTQALPGSQAGSVERGLEKEGILRCSWKSPGGLLFLVASEEPEDSATAEARGWVDAFVDPLRPEANRRVRFEAVPGIGDETIAVVERQDPANGILQDAAFIVVRRGKWQVSLLAPKLARRERADALRALAALAKGVAGRLR